MRRELEQGGGVEVNMDQPMPAVEWANLACVSDESELKYELG
jgi:hypothetical protein